MSPTNNDKPSMTADPLLLTTATGAKRSTWRER